MALAAATIGVLLSSSVSGIVSMMVSLTDAAEARISMKQTGTKQPSSVASDAWRASFSVLPNEVRSPPRVMPNLTTVAGTETTLVPSGSGENGGCDGDGGNGVGGGVGGEGDGEVVEVVEAVGVVEAVA